MYFSDYYFRPLDEMTDADLNDVTRCGCCGGKNTFQTLDVFQETPKISFVRCRRCGAVTYDRILKQEKLDEIYENYSYLQEDQEKASKDKVTFYGKTRFAKHFLKLMQNHNILPEKESIRILDFGGGDGSLSYALSLQMMEVFPYSSIEIVVVDYTDDPCESSVEEISLRHAFPLSSLPGNEPFDIILASAVLEHLPTPGKELLRLSSLAAPGAVLYFRTPYKYPLYSLLRRFGSTLDMLYPRHIWDLGDVWWKRILKCLRLEDQLELVESRPSIVEKSMKEHFFLAFTATAMKAPWYVTHRWKYVGGWEAVYTHK